MRGFAMLEPNKVGFIEKPDPIVGPRDALVKPISLSPCTSDIHTVYEGALGERPEWNLILGHEGAGEVVTVGADVKDFKPGDKVLIPAITPDWSGLGSQAGYSVHDDQPLGGWKFSNTKDGTFSTRIHINDADANIEHLPYEEWQAVLDETHPGEGWTPEHIAPMLSDMVPTGVHGSELSGVTFGDTVAVIGIGPVGLMGLRGAVLHGAGRIFAVGNRPKTVEVAKEYGATDIVDYKAGDIVEQILSATDGKGVDKVIIAGGDSAHTFDQAVKILKPGGNIGNINYLNGNDTVQFSAGSWVLGMGHKTIHGGLMPGGRLRMKKLASLVTAKRIDLTKLITHKFEGFDKIQDAVELMHNKTPDLIKPVVIVNDID